MAKISSEGFRSTAATVMALSGNTSSYSAYQPRNLAMVLTIFKVTYNYCLEDAKGESADEARGYRVLCGLSTPASCSSRLDWGRFQRFQQRFHRGYKCTSVVVGLHLVGLHCTLHHARGRIDIGIAVAEYSKETNPSFDGNAGNKLFSRLLDELIQDA